MPSDKTRIKPTSNARLKNMLIIVYKVKKHTVIFFIVCKPNKRLLVEFCPSKQIFVILRLGFKIKEQDGDDNKKNGEQDQQWHGMAYMDLKYGIRISLLGNILSNLNKKTTD